MNRDRLIIAFTLMAGIVVAAVAWKAFSYRAAHAPAAARATEGALPHDYPRLARAMPAFRLVDQTGAAFDDAMLAGQPTILSFVFAHCSAICPALVRGTRRAAEELGPQNVRLVWVTLDPERDVPDSLASIAARWQLPPTGRLLSGDPAAVGLLLDSLGVARGHDPASGELAHPPLVYVLDASGRIAYAFNGPSVGWMVEGVRRAAAPH